MNLRVVGCAVSLGVTVLALTGAGCSSASKRSGFETEVDPNAPGGDGGSLGFQNDGGTSGGSSCSINNLAKDPDLDSDGDGFPLKYDCNECDPNVNAGAFDVPGNGIDEDCNGTPDDEPADCDTGLAMTGDAFDGAAAMGLCKKATDDKMWGVVKAEWVKPDGTSQSVALGEGILSAFGVNAPQAGASMAAISSGAARAPSDSGYKSPGGYDKNYSHGTPAGYPKESPSCAGSGLGGLFGDSNDGAALKVTIRVPTNAKSFSYQQNFFTYEFPGYICTDFNDFFVTIMDPKPAGLPDGNIAFDQDGNPISVNNSLLQVCSPQNAGNKAFPCPLGNSTLSGTGFESHAATGWLTTTAPVETERGKEITLMFAVWDQGDGVLDSTVLLDDFKWSVDGADGTATKPTPPK
ncbi:MAG: hypothetical protein JWP97_320 [Labilithrix sp.]|nr:hypothetical protein [Labilithrix sp.]